MKKAIKTTIIFLLLLGVVLTFFACSDKGGDTLSPDLSDNTPPENPLPPSDENRPQISPVKYTIKFFTAENELYDTQQITSGEKAIIPIAPTQNKKLFVAWTTDTGDNYDFNEPIISDVNIFAEWKDIVVEKVRLASDSAHKKSFALTEFFNSEGLKIEAIYTDDAVVSLSEEDYEVDDSEYENNRPGVYDIAVKTAYGDLHYSVIVEGVVALRVVDNNIYADGDSIDFDTVEVFKIYSDGSELPASKNEIGLYSQNGGGAILTAIEEKDTIRAVLLDYLVEVTVEYHVTVYDISSAEPESLRISAFPALSYTTGMTIGDCSGLVVVKTIKNFANREFEMILGVDFELVSDKIDLNLPVAKAGKYDITVRPFIGEITTFFTVTVFDVEEKMPDALRAICKREKLYRTEEFDKTLLEVYAVYGNEVEIGPLDIKKCDIDVSAYDGLTVGFHSISIECAFGDGDEKVVLSTSVNIEVAENPMVGTFYTEESNAQVYSLKIEVDEKGRLLVKEYDGELDDWTPSSRVDFSVASFEVRGDKIVIEGVFEYDIATASFYFEENKETLTKLQSDDVILSIEGIEGVNGFFILVKKGEGISEDRLAALRADGIILKLDDSGQLREITSADKFYENGKIYAEI